MDSTYLQTVQKTMCKIHIHILSTQCTIKTYLVINYTLYTVCTHLHYVHYLYIMQSIHSNNVKVQQIMHMQCLGCAFCMVSSDSRCVSAVCVCSPVELC